MIIVDKTEKNRIIGIVGGMGPWAGIDLAQHMTRLTQSNGDQEHLDFVMMSFPGSITDRTLFIENKATINPAYSISDIIRKLEMIGAEVIGLACNSSHVPEIYEVIIDELEKVNSSVQLVHMPRETCRFIRKEYPFAKRIGVMSTDGTYKAGLYKNLLNDLGFDVILPDEGFQHNVIHEMIYAPGYGIKSTGDIIRPQLKQLLYEALDFFEENNAEVIILGCTELSLVMKDSEIRGIKVVNSNEVLAKALINASVVTKEVEMIGV